MDKENRREAMKQMAWFSLAMSLDHAFAQSDSLNGWAPDGSSNFKTIYQNPALYLSLERHHQIQDRLSESPP